MNKVLFDTNIILDIALKRIPHYEASSKLFELIDLGVIEAYISGSSITDIYYIARKEKGNDITRKFLLELIQIVPVLGVDHNIVLKALQSNFADFEDAVQVFSADANNLDYIITRNKKDFIGSEIEILSPKEALVVFLDGISYLENEEK